MELDRDILTKMFKAISEKGTEVNDDGYEKAYFYYDDLIDLMGEFVDFHESFVREEYLDETL